MSPLTITVDVMPGTLVRAAAEEMLRLANLTGCWVECDFNGVTARMRPNGNVDLLVENFTAALARDGTVKMAFG